MTVAQHAHEAGEAADQAIKAAEVATKAARRVEKPLDPREAPHFEALRRGEPLALQGSRPRRRRWRDLAKFDDEHDRLQGRLEEALTRLREAEAALTRAPAADASRLAGWIAGGERGERP